MGLVGTLLGTSIALLCTASWNWPRLVYKYTFKKSVIEYYRIYCARFLLLALLVFITAFLIQSVIGDANGFAYIVVRGVVSLVVFVLAFVLIYVKTPEFQYIRSSVNNLLRK